MANRGRLTVATLSLMLLFILGLSGCLDDTSNDPPDPDLPARPDIPDWSRGAVFTNATWSNPWDGDLAVSVTLGAQDPTDCSVLWAAWGVSDHLYPTFGFVVNESDGSVYSNFGRGQGNFDASVRVHAAGALDEEANPAEYGWGEYVNRTYTLSPDGPLVVTGMAIGLQSDDPDGLRPTYSYLPQGLENASALIQISCDGPVELMDLGFGKDVTIFNEATLRGGVGVHAHAAFDPTGATVASSVEMDVENERGLLVLGIYGDILLNHVGVGVIDMAYPDGSETHVDHPTQNLAGCATGLPACPLGSYFFEAGPGTYSVTATYASVDIMSIVQGAIAGLDPVEELPRGIPS